MTGRCSCVAEIDTTWWNSQEKDAYLFRDSQRPRDVPGEVFVSELHHQLPGLFIDAVDVTPAKDSGMSPG